ncbi:MULTISPECIES: caspase family protein [Bradyrhizobium]|jgi:uncharacterized caspase-like protein|uniref:Uncharacterized protein, contains caspase domain n=2 Tax=Bradyrhizobium TaxID=374 RepID=A0ABY0Q2A1_9BRAD|nr:Uncharacterized protein, contains caspase domain [Bradyrhizobium ottawaense]SEC63542.1 Uncharacterized protein, contains caspase domain [Bradyrhizobium lablabi]SHK79894.1 Uncharacterized protein, contains caspase domain [Bradyrhizobium lablabi]
MRACWASVAAIFLIFGLYDPAFAEKRVALVIGNSAYQNVGRLLNPANDSAAMSETFKSAGFDVVELKRDVKANEMRRALRDFSDSVRDADVAIVYYAGHGIEIDGTNYLVPTDATLERDIDAYDEAIPLERLLAVIEPARKLRLVILDACRDNPFSKSMKRTIASRAIGRGLAKVDPTSPNTLVAFAAKAGSTASDGDGKNSPFTAALVKYLPKPGLDLRKAFGFARDEVLKTTGNRQEPFIYGSLGGDDFALVPAAVPAPAVAPAVDSSQGVRADYELAERVGTKEAWDFFLSTYPDGFYAKLAQAQRNKLEAEQSRLAAIEKSRSAEEERARLAAEGAKASAQAKAAAEARAADEARAAAERKKVLEEAKIVEVERAQAKAAEEARLAAERKKEIEQTKAAEAEHARLVLQAKAAADARIAAENARAAAEAEVKREQLALERAKALAEEKAAEAARIRAEAQARAEQDAKVVASTTKAAEEAKANQDAERARQQKVVQEARLAEAERGRLAAQVKANEASTNAVTADDAVRKEAQSVVDQKAKPIGPLANLTPPNDQGASAPGQESLPRLLQAQLRRVGCGSDPVTGDWDASAQKALHLFNKNAGTKFDVRVATIDALDVVRGKTGRICPLLCEHGFKADGDSCVKIICKDGLELSDDNSCERVERQKPRRKEAPTATLTPERATAPSPERQREPAAPSAIQRADLAKQVGGYRQCMGALPGCYERAIRNRSPEAARAWCNRRPTC